MATDTLTVNDNLVRFDNLLTALNYLMEEVQTRKEQVLQTVDIDAKIINHMESRDFKSTLVNHIRHEYGQGMYQEVAFLVMEKIDNDISKFINARVDERLRAAEVNVPDAVVSEG